MEIECLNKCGNLTDSPDYDKCKTCRMEEAGRENTQGLINKDYLLSIEDLQTKHQEAMLKFVSKRT